MSKRVLPMFSSKSFIVCSNNLWPRKILDYMYFLAKKLIYILVLPIPFGAVYSEPQMAVSQAIVHSKTLNKTYISDSHVVHFPLSLQDQLSQSHPYMTTGKTIALTIWTFVGKGHKEGGGPKNWCFWNVVLEKTLESPLDCKEIKPVNSTGNQVWIFIGRTDVEAKAPIVWPPDGKNRLTGKDSNTSKDWRQKEKRVAED